METKQAWLHMKIKKSRHKMLCLFIGSCFINSPIVVTNLAEWAHLVLNLKFGRHVSSHKQSLKGIITTPYFESPT
jgi:hypothetical protein